MDEDIMMLAVIGAAAYVLYKKNFFEGLSKAEVVQAVGERPNSEPSLFTEKTPTYFTREGNTLYRINESNLSGASPFEKRLLKSGYSVGMVEKVSAIRSAPARFFSWVGTL